MDANPLVVEDYHYSSEKQDDLNKIMIDKLEGHHDADAFEWGQQEAAVFDTLAAEDQLLVSSDRDHRRNLEFLYWTDDGPVCR